MVLIFWLLAGFYVVSLVLSFLSNNRCINSIGIVVLLALPFVGMVLAAKAREFTGCSEYKQFRSDYCENKSAESNINLEEVKFLSEMLSYLLFTYVAIPALLFICAKKIIEAVERKWRK